MFHKFILHQTVDGIPQVGARPLFARFWSMWSKAVSDWAKFKFPGPGTCFCPSSTDQCFRFETVGKVLFLALSKHIEFFFTKKKCFPKQKGLQKKVSVKILGFWEWIVKIAAHSHSCPLFRWAKNGTVKQRDSNSLRTKLFYLYERIAENSFISFNWF